MKNKLQYCNNLIKYDRRLSRVVPIGNIPLGGDNPIRLQSMTTTNTMDTNATVEQSIRMIHAGCEYVRITAPTNNDAKNLINIQNKLRGMGYDTPLIADIHFTPRAAEIAARIVNKVRINPGNFADKKRFNYIDYSDEDYLYEIERIRKRFLPLVKVCKEYGTAMRIGTNHGSLSDRILSRYGDTPLGMVESALEFIRLCSDEGYNDIVLSMKSSNPIVMVQAYRLLVLRMDEEGMDYPLHLGVTEAGDGEDGRIKSSVGIGALLEDGLGDTVRVSLTEEPEFEIPVASLLAGRYRAATVDSQIPPISTNPINPFDYNNRKTKTVATIGSDYPARVIIDFSSLKSITRESLDDVGYKYLKNDDKWGISDQACDFLYIGDNSVDFKIPGTLGLIQKFSKWNSNIIESCYPLMSINEYRTNKECVASIKFVCVSIADLDLSTMSDINKDRSVVLIIYMKNKSIMQNYRRAFMRLINNKCNAPVIVRSAYNDISYEELQVFSSTDLGGLFIDGIGNGIWVDAYNICNADIINGLSFGILQACRARISKTEYISCPSCGRTLFDLQETTARIRSRTGHLKGLKIGVMGCIVNGPGEMADADYGYVGTGKGVVSLYKGQEVVKSNLPTENAVDELINLIDEHGDWVDPK